MSDGAGSCEYLLDPDAPETWDGEEGDKCYVDEGLLNEDGVWACPHDTEDNEDLCIFHRPVVEKSDADVVDAFLAVLDGCTDQDREISERELHFIGAKFGDFDLSGNLSTIALRGVVLNFSHVHVAGIFDWSDLALETEEVRFRGATFGGETVFRAAHFECDVDFRASTFCGYAHFTETEFACGAEFGRGRFEEDLVFRRATFGEVAQFTDTIFAGHTDFRSTEFRDDADFQRATFEAYSGFLSVEFAGTADFFETSFEGDIDFRRTVFQSEVEFLRQNLTGARFQRSNLSNARFTDAICRDAIFESAVLNRATLHGADLRGARLSGAALGDVQIDEDTRFLGHHSDDGDVSPHTFSAIRSRPTCVYDPDYEENNEHTDVDKAKSVYRALEELGRKHARPRLQTRSFVRRQDLQKGEYKQDAKTAESWEERLIAGARYSRATVARATLLYGESPWRVIGWSLAIILGFALLYPLGGWMQPADGAPITYTQIASNPAEILNSVYYSTLTYTALGFGDFQPVGFGRLLTTLETGLGAVMLALLVFILGRRAAR